MSVKTVAGIDIGSNAIRLIIADIDNRCNVTTIDELRKNTGIGRDTFNSGKISINSIQETCQTLKKFAELMYEYQVDDYKAVATSGLREAKNREYVIEQIRLRTGLQVEIINNAEERFLTYKAIRDKLPDFKWMKNDGLLIVDIGSGGVEISIYDSGNLKFTDYLKVGSLRLSEILADLESVTLDFPRIMEKYIDRKIHLLKPVIDKVNVNNFIGLGGELDTIKNILKQEDKDTDKVLLNEKTFKEFYMNVSNLTVDQIKKKYGTKHKVARVLLPSIIIFNYFLNLTGVKGIYTPPISLRHGLIAELIDKHFDPVREHDFIEDIVSSVCYIGENYNIDMAHSHQVEKLALSIFNQTENIHNLNERDRLYLQVAALLHDIGKNIKLNEHVEHSYNMILAQDIIGFSNRELKITANIARYHSYKEPELFHNGYKSLNYRDRIKVAKLSAIMKLANSLDISYKQSISEVQITKEDMDLIFNVNTNKEVLLEKWSFQKQVDFYEEVFGYRPQLMIKDDLYGY